MRPLAEIIAFLEAHAPPALAESWDNVGLLVGDREVSVTRVMTCLTITPATAREAVSERADLIVSHHPLPFRPLKRLTTDQPEGRLLLTLAAARVAVYSPHTGFDSAAEGINQQWANALALSAIAPLAMLETGGGAGRIGVLDAAISLSELAARAMRVVGAAAVQYVGNADQAVRRVAIACGSAGELFGSAIAANADALVTGELRFHTCLEAEAAGLGVALVGHYCSERFGIERLAQSLAAQFGDLTVWASRDEADPLRWLSGP